MTLAILTSGGPRKRERGNDFFFSCIFVFPHKWNFIKKDKHEIHRSVNGWIDKVYVFLKSLTNSIFVFLKRAQVLIVFFYLTYFYHFRHPLHNAFYLDIHRHGFVTYKIITSNPGFIFICPRQHVSLHT